MPKTLKRTIASIFVLSVLVFPIVSFAQPAAIQVCKQVLDDHDANLAEGGDWVFTVGDDANDLIGGTGTVTITRTENENANPLDCSPIYSFLVGSAGLSVFEQSPTFEWTGNAPGFPAWEIVDSANPNTIFKSGNGQNAVLSTAEFAAVPAGVTLAVNYTNAEIRTLTICKLVEDNGDTVANQGKTWAIIASSVTSDPSRNIAAFEGDGIVCDTNPITLNFAEINNRFIENLFGVVSAAGYPKFTMSDSKGNPDITHIASNQNGTIFTDFGLDAWEDNVQLLVTNQYDIPKTFKFCKQLEDNGDGENNGGAFSFMWDSAQRGTTSSLSVGSVIEGGPEVCRNAINVNSSYRQILVAETGYRAIWDGNAPGYPKWELRTDDLANTLIASGVGDTFEFDFDADTVNGIALLAPLTLNQSAFKIVFINKEGDFGNGDNDPATGGVLHACKKVLVDGDTVNDGGNFRISIVATSGIAPTGGWSTHAFNANGTKTLNSVNELNSNPNEICSRFSSASLPWVTSLSISETNPGGAFRGNALGYPILKFKDSTTTDLGYAEFMPISPFNIGRVEAIVDDSSRCLST